MNISQFLIILFVISNSFILIAQNNKEKDTKRLPENIEAIDSKFSFSPIYINEYSFFKIKSRAESDAGEMKYKPNVTASVGAKISIKNFSISYVHALPQSEDFGKTKSTNLIFNIQKRIFGMQLFWIKYEGLYIDTLDRYRLYNDMYINGIDNAFILRPDIKLNDVGFKNYFIFRKDFSVNAAFEQTERQKKTAGSFVLMYGGNFIKVENQRNNSLILESQKKFYPKISNLYRLNSIAFKIAPGLGYSFIVKKYFSFSFIFLAGPSAQYKWYRLNVSDYTRYGLWLSYYYEIKSAFGYNGKIFIANIIYSRSQDILGFSKKYNNNYDCKTNFNFFREYIKLSIGVRIM